MPGHTALELVQHEDEEDAARNGRHREEGHRDERGHVIGQEGASGLPVWATPSPEES